MLITDRDRTIYVYDCPLSEDKTAKVVSSYCETFCRQCYRGMVKDMAQIDCEYLRRTMDGARYCNKVEMTKKTVEECITCLVSERTIDVKDVEYPVVRRIKNVKRKV
jgi:hypothetical protein